MVYIRLYTVCDSILLTPVEDRDRIRGEMRETETHIQRKREEKKIEKV